MSMAMIEEAGAGSAISGELSAALAAVTDESGVDGPRYVPHVARLLVRTVAARAYGRPLLELGHLLRAAAVLSGRGGYPSFFWRVRRADRLAFESLCLDAARRSSASGRIRVAGGEVRLLYPSDEFAVTFARMPFLAALLDFAVTALGFAAVDEEAETLLAAPFEKAAAGVFANRMSKRLYDFLALHLPSQQWQRKFREMTAFLGARGIAGAEEIDDESVLEFWTERARKAEGAGDFRSYRATVESFLRLCQALEQAAARRAVAGARPIGPDRAAGEVDPAEVEECLAAAEDDEDALEVLARPPADAVKFLNRRERASLALACGSPSARRLPLSVLRAEVWGDHQARITQALRSTGSRTSVAALIGATPREGYAERLAAWRTTLDHLDTVRHAVAYLLLRNRQPAGIAAMMRLAPSLDISRMASVLEESESEKVVRLRPRDAIAVFFDLLDRSDPAVGEALAFFRDGRRAFAGLSRQGFEESSASKTTTIAAAEAAEGPLARVSTALQVYLERLIERLGGAPADDRLRVDAARFAEGFGHLYGGALR